MIKYCCDMCKKDIAYNKVIKATVPLPQYVWARSGMDNVKIMPFLQGICEEEIEVCSDCYTKIGRQLEYLGLKSKTWNE